MSVVCCQVEVSAKGPSPVQRSPTECGVSECDNEASSIRGLGQLRQSKHEIIIIIIITAHGTLST